MNQYTGNNRQGQGGGKPPYNKPNYSSAGKNANAPKEKSATLNRINLQKIDVDLFDATAEQMAKEISDDQKAAKSSQLRRFYDELVMWQQKIEANPERFDDYLPFIKMLRSKVVYAKERRVANDEFVDMMSHCIAQLKTREHFSNFKVFFEAFLGFYKKYNHETPNTDC